MSLTGGGGPDVVGNGKEVEPRRTDHTAGHLPGPREPKCEENQSYVQRVTHMLVGFFFCRNRRKGTAATRIN